MMKCFRQTEITLITLCDAYIRNFFIQKTNENISTFFIKDELNHCQFKGYFYLLRQRFFLLRLF